MAVSTKNITIVVVSDRRLGVPGTGRTALCKRFVYNSFEDDDKHNQSDDVNVFEKDIHWTPTSVKLKIIDVPEHFTRLSWFSNEVICKADGVMWVYDSTNHATVDHIPEMVGKSIVLVGTKCDDTEPVPFQKDEACPFRFVKHSEGAAKAAQLGCPFFEVSAKTGHNVSAAFDALIGLCLNNNE